MASRYVPHLFAISCFLFQALMNACVKALGPDVPVSLTLGVRCLIGLMIMVPAIFFAGGFRKVITTPHPQKQMTRGLLSMFGVGCSYYAVQFLPLGDAAALWNTYGFFLLMLSMPILHERISWKQYIACAVGFFGVLLIARPHGSVHIIAVIIMLVSAVSSAAGTLTVRLMSRHDKELTIMTWFFMTGSVVCLTVWLLFADKFMLDGHQIILLLSAGVFGSVSQLSMTKAFRHLGAERMGSYTYSGIVFSLIIGFICFAEIPTLWMVLGAGLIVAGMQLSHVFNRQKPPVVT